MLMILGIFPHPDRPTKLAGMQDTAPDAKNNQSFVIFLIQYSLDDYTV